jgi:hypothetical protein
MKIPRTKIPKIVPLCTTCGGKATTTLGTPYAEGYFRRHRCADTGCATSFYSLTPYGGGAAKLSALPFKDRELTEFEAELRLQWWRELGTGVVTMEVTTSAFLERVKGALEKKEYERTPQDEMIVAVFDGLKQEIEQMDAQDEKE